MIEAMEFMKVTTPNLADNVVKTIQQEISSSNNKLENLPDTFADAVFEFECYVLYFVCFKIILFLYIKGI